MSNLEEKSKDFIPIDDAEEVTRYLTEAAITHSSTIIWTKSQEKVVQSQLVHPKQGIKLICVRIPKDFNLKKFMDDSAPLGTTEFFFNISLIGSKLFFKTNFKDYDNSTLKFQCPVKIYRVQRRQGVRFQIPDLYSLYVEFQEPLLSGGTIKKKIFDISTEGLSFLTSDQGLPLFSKGLALKGLQIKIRDRLICCDAEVRQERTKLPNLSLSKDQIKVGVKFNNISENDTDFLASYIFDEIRKFVSRFL